MKIKNKKYIILTVSSAVLLFALLMRMTGYSQWSLSNGIGINCVSTYKMPELPDGSKYTGSLSLHTYQNGSGEVVFSGILAVPGAEGKSAQQLVILRSITFTYQKIDTDIFKLTDFHTSKKSLDTVSDTFFAKVIFDIAEPEKSIRISSLHNGYLIGNTFSPTTLCVTKSQ